MQESSNISFLGKIVMTRTALLVLIIGTMCSSVLAQQKPWSQWEKKEVDKMLNASPWGQTQSETNAGQVTAQIGTGQANQETTYNYRVRLFSARPIREAFARMVMLGNPKIQASQLTNFVIGDYSELIVVAITFDGTDRGLIGPLGQAFASATTGTLKNKAYIERKDGKRIWIEDYAAPTSDNTGAKFVFPRMLDGKPFVGEGDEFLRFVVDMDRGANINWKFKLSDMKYDGKLEF